MFCPIEDKPLVRVIFPMAQRDADAVCLDAAVFFPTNLPRRLQVLT